MALSSASLDRVATSQASQCKVRIFIGRWVEFLLEIVPNLYRLGIFANFKIPNAAAAIRELQAAANSKGLEVSTGDIRKPDDIAPAAAVRE
jgi:ABC-type uncharacterized transport system substrate-binding protein